MANGGKGQPRLFKRRIAALVREMEGALGSTSGATRTLKVSRSTFYNYRGTDRRPEAVTDPGLNELRGIGRATNVSLDWLFFAPGGTSPVYRDSTRSTAQLDDDLLAECVRRISGRTGLAAGFVRDFVLRDVGIGAVLDEVTASLAERAMRTARSVRRAKRSLAESLAESHMTPEERLEK
ncbi:MAG: hypothetical protein KGL35_11140, partial [Bradyrhizobium sp.]|nr:hypothetical protein [Bradyrhizobium sp.]